MSESLVHLPQLVATPRERPKTLSLGQGAEDRNHGCDFYDDCLDEAVKRGWASWDCAECGRRDVHSERVRTEMLELASSRIGEGPPVPQMVKRRGADEPSPAKAKELRQQLLAEQEQQRRDTRDRVREENWRLKTAAFWAPETVEVLAAPPPPPPALRPARELRGEAAPRQRGPVAEDADVDLRPVPPEPDEEPDELPAPARPAAVVRPVDQVASLVAAAAGAPVAQILSRSFTHSRPTRPASPRSPMSRPTAAELPKGQLPTLQDATAAVELATRELDRAKERLRLVVAEVDAQLAPARAALGTVLTSAEPLVLPAELFPRLKPKTIGERIEVALEDDKVHLVQDLAAVLGETRPAVACALGRLVKEGLAIRTGRGAYARQKRPAAKAAAKKTKAAAPKAPAAPRGGSRLKGTILPGSTADLFLELLKTAPKGLRVVELQRQANCSIPAAACAVRRLRASGRVKQLDRGVYALAAAS